ncbi:MAG: DUF1343 domain-containing protein, partial [Akkermansiaceae bacterium]|nr:DUF1343 domain-containing protein [Akkermansiaceae bacterium]
RLCIHDPARFRPVEATVKIISALLNLHDPGLFWESPGARPEFLDKLMGDASVREQLSGGVDPNRIIEGWQQGHAAFARSRADALLYAAS